jgi:ribosomal-protein-alanine N-acetyltransferase
MSVTEPAVLQFSRIQEEHLDDILEIEVEAYPEPWSRGMFLDEINNDRSYFFCAFLGDVLIGYCGFWLVLDEAHITSIVVRKEFRGQGFGRKLVTFLLDKATELGVKTATLEVRVSNLAARNLYLLFGFSPVGIRKGYYPKTNEDAIVMLKEF